MNLPTSDQVLKTLKIIGMIVGGIVALIVIIVPGVLLLKYLNKNNETITIHPKFKIIKIENNNDIDTNTLTEAVKIGNQMLQKIKDIK